MKREYAKPEMSLVQLRAEEAVLTACKSWSNGGTGAYMPGGFGGGFGNCQVVESPKVSRCNIVGS